MMADDQGWGDTGYNGHPVVKTPHLDAMAREGVRFDRFYSAAPVCSPTRGSCLTGRHPFRYGIYFANAGGPGQASEYALPRQETTLAQVLKGAGYRTGHFGKWHLGDFEGEGSGGAGSKRMSPSDAGFDEWFSTVRKVPTLDPPASEYWENGKPVAGPLTGDDSRLIMDRALGFLQRDSAKPFFAVIWLHAPHLPVVAAAEFRQLYAAHGEAEQHYWGAITALDQQVGRLRSELRRLDPAGDTMLWYASDNGPEGDRQDARSPGSAGPWRGRKASLFEGGIRVPALLEWPAVIRRPRVIAPAASTSDYFPTVLDALGLKPHDARPLDGISLLPVIFGKQKAPEGQAARPKPIAFETSRITRGSPRLALIDGDMKLLTNLTADRSSDLLFNLRADPAEQTNLAAARPADCDRLRAVLAEWRASCRRSNAGEDYPQEALDVVYGKTPEGVELRLDIAWPGAANHDRGPFPLILCLHGGGWSMGSRRSFHKMMREFAARQFVAASMEYRLAPGARHPAQADDIRAALRFLREDPPSSPKRWQVNPKQVALLGASAGAHLALVAGLPETNPREQVQAIVDISGPADLRDWRMSETADRTLQKTTGKSSRDLVTDLLGPSPPPARVESASPVALIHRHSPPVLIFQWREDQAVAAGQAERLAAGLKRASVRHELVWLAGRGHALNGPGVETIVPRTVEFLGGLRAFAPANRLVGR